MNGRQSRRWTPAPALNDGNITDQVERCVKHGTGESSGINILHPNPNEAFRIPIKCTMAHFAKLSDERKQRLKSFLTNHVILSISEANEVVQDIKEDLGQVSPNGKEIAETYLYSHQDLTKCKDETQRKGIWKQFYDNLKDHPVVKGFEVSDIPAIDAFVEIVSLYFIRGLKDASSLYACIKKAGLEYRIKIGRNIFDNHPEIAWLDPSFLRTAVCWESCICVVSFLLLLGSVPDPQNVKAIREFCQHPDLTQPETLMKRLAQLGFNASISLGEAILDAKDEVGNDENKVSLIGVHFYEQTVINEYKPFQDLSASWDGTCVVLPSHYFVVAVGVHGIRVFHAMTLAPIPLLRLDEGLAKKYSRLRNWDETGQFLRAFDSLSKASATWDCEEAIQAYKFCFDIDLKKVIEIYRKKIFTGYRLPRVKDPLVVVLQMKAVTAKNIQRRFIWNI